MHPDLHYYEVNYREDDGHAGKSEEQTKVPTNGRKKVAAVIYQSLLMGFNIHGRIRQN